MGSSHARAYTKLPGVEVAGVCSRGVHKITRPPEIADARAFTSFDEALAMTKPDVVSINTFPDTHAEFAIKAMESGAHVFVEKPLAETVAEAERWLGPNLGYQPED